MYQCLRCLKSCPVDPKALSCKDNRRYPDSITKLYSLFLLSEVCPEGDFYQGTLVKNYFR